MKEGSWLYLSSLLSPELWDVRGACARATSVPSLPVIWAMIKQISLDSALGPGALPPLNSLIQRMRLVHTRGISSLISFSVSGVIGPLELSGSFKFK